MGNFQGTAASSCEAEKHRITGSEEKTHCCTVESTGRQSRKAVESTAPMIFELKNSHAVATAPSVVISLRCPACKQIGTFESRVPNMTDVVFQSGSKATLGQRSCP